LAGGTTLVDLMKLNVEQTTHLIDINGIPELAYIDVADKIELKLGSLARMSEVADHPFIKANYPVLSESLWKAASPQLRNMASLGGNLLQRTRCAYFRDPQFACNKRMPGAGCSATEGINRGHAILGGSEQCIATYPGDWAIALVALDAAVDTLSPRGRRSIPIGELYREPGKTPHIENTLDHDELIVRIRVPATRLGRASTYQKVRDRESYAFALTSAAVALDMSGKIVKDARIAIGGVASRPWRARVAERSLVGKKLTDAAARQAGELAFEGARTTPQNAFRLPLGINTVVEALFIALQRA
jgi:xanthine dehydrogenase YagS FAD-binding subunit